MRVLVLGASGFIGQNVAIHLAGAEHNVTGLSRSIDKASVRLSQMQWLKADLATMIAPADWEPLLTGYDAVVNCAGALQESFRDNVAAVQHHAMLALYTAAARQNQAPLIIQISAPANLKQANTPFMDTKLSADTALAQSGVPFVILRPTLVMGRNAYGGSALLRGLAAMPFVTALAYADNPVNAVHNDDVAETVLKALNGKIPHGTDAVLASPNNRPLKETIALQRQWLGLPANPVVKIPAPIASAVSLFADAAVKLGWRTPLNSTAMAINKHSITASHYENTLDLPDPFIRLMQTPAGAQDVWFARLYLLKPLVIMVLSVFWIASGIIPLLNLEASAAPFRTTAVAAFAMPLTVITSLLDIALGFAVLVQSFACRALILMLLVSLAYLGSGTILQPELWLEPLGPLVKIIPIAILIVMALAILEER